MSTTNSGNAINKEWIKLAVTIGLPLLLLLLPTNALYSAEIRLFLVITMMGIFAWAFNIVPQAIPAIMLPIAYLLFGLAPGNVIFGAWSGYIPWMMFGGVILANVLQSTGLLKRIAYKCIVLTGASYMGILMGLALTGIIGNLLAPGKMTVPMAALTYGICMALDTGKSRASAGIMLGGAMGALLPQQFIYNPTNIALTVGVGKAVTGDIALSWFDYFYYNIPAILFMFVAIYVTGRMCKPHDFAISKDYFVGEAEKLGAMTSVEKKALLVCLALFAFLLTGSLHHLEIGWGFAIFPCFLFFPGINAGRREDIEKMDFSFVLFIATCLGIGATAGELGIGRIIGELAGPMVADKSIFFTFALVWMIVFLANFVLTPLAIMAAISLPMAQVAMDLNINPLSIYFLMTNAYDQILFPYEYALYLIFFSFNLIHLKDFMQVMAVKSIINFVMCIGVMVPYWMLVGLI